jgi:hypothetical protein
VQTVIDVDDEALERAKQVLGTTTKVETVNAALRRVAGSPHEALNSWPRSKQLMFLMTTRTRPPVTLDRGVA